MAKDKKSFIGYADWGDTFEMLDDVEAGKLIKHFFQYIRDENPSTEDKLLQMAFHPIKLQLKRDLVKYEDTKEKRAAIGRYGGLKSGEARRKKNDMDEPKVTNNEADEPIASLASKNEANEADNVNDTDTDTVTVNDTVSKRANALVVAEAPTDVEAKILKSEYRQLISDLNGKDLKTVWAGLKSFISEKSPPFIEPYQEVWNLFAKKYDLAKVEVISDNRKKKFRVRHDESSFDFLRILEKIKSSAMLKGIDTNSTWKVTFDWVFENQSNYVKILEGNYDGN